MSANIELGTLIHGTLRTQDLLQAFADELERINPDALSRVLKIYPEVRGKSATNIAEVDQTSIGEVLSEAIEMLMDALNEYAPGGCYFGSIEGDGADFGFWEISSED
jgi:GAF domain-containing protein